MSRELVNAFCATQPGTSVADPWGGGHDAWKVGGKVFAIVGSKGTGVSVKTPDAATAAMLIDVGRATKAAYLHRSWIFVPFELVGTGPDDISEAELLERIAISYTLVRSKLPKRIRATLAEPDIRD